MSFSMFLAIFWGFFAAFGFIFGDFSSFRFFLATSTLDGYCDIFGACGRALGRERALGRNEKYNTYFITSTDF